MIPSLHTPTPHPRTPLIFALPFLLVIPLTGCTGPRLMSFPYDASGRSLNSPYGENQPRLAGRYLVFVSDRQGTQDIYLYDTVARSLVELPGLNAIDMVAEQPGISEDGRLIVFVGTRQERSGIYLYDRETRQLRNLTETLKAAVRSPSISADGNVIAFESSANGGQWDIVLINRMGQPMTPADLAR